MLHAMGRLTMRNTCSYRRRGSVYVFVLTIAMFVIGIGLSGLLAVRVERRSASITETGVKASSSASSLIEVALLRINTNPDWRTTYSHDVWVANEAVGEVTYTFKLVDERDGNLANDVTQPVRLYAKATVGDAVRIYSVLLEPAADDGTVAADNLLTNGDIESGTTSWLGNQCFIGVDPSGDFHGGARCLLVLGRIFTSSGPYQAVTSSIQNGTTYNIELWVKMAGTTPGNIVIDVETQSTGSGTLHFTQGSTAVGTSWTRVTSTLTPTWSGTLTAAYWKIYTTSGLEPFKIDDAVMSIPGSGTDATVVPRTWRREVLP